MTAAHQNPPTTKQIRVTPPQMASLAVMDTVAGTIATAAGLLGDHMRQTDAADILVGIAQALNAQKAALIEKWASAIQIVGPEALPPLGNGPVILSKR